MREVIPDEVVRGFAQTATWAELPDFVRAHREYASQIGLALGGGGEDADEKEHRAEVRARVQAVETPRVPQGLG